MAGVTAPKPSAPRVAALRERRAALGLVRLELWVRPADVRPIRQFAATLNAPKNPAEHAPGRVNPLPPTTSRRKRAA